MRKKLGGRDLSRRRSIEFHGKPFEDHKETKQEELLLAMRFAKDDDPRVAEVAERACEVEEEPDERSGSKGRGPKKRATGVQKMTHEDNVSGAMAGKLLAGVEPSQEDIE